MGLQMRGRQQQEQPSLGAPEGGGSRDPSCCAPCNRGDRHTMRRTWPKIFSPPLSSLERAAPSAERGQSCRPAPPAHRRFSQRGLVDLNPSGIGTRDSSSPAEKGNDRHVTTFPPPVLRHSWDAQASLTSTHH